ncbi:ELWxxDGT repeat protein [Hyalangium versicolor]|uniref:ELWxxDGT repeat protein n=1 Tax=Hyalangium versicolor TaxID=2861190 RepID=UPI001CCF845E|nr:ELWxxDGT repeat protein [Hyalangium versicolor]
MMARSSVWLVLLCLAAGCKKDPVPEPVPPTRVRPCGPPQLVKALPIAPDDAPRQVADLKGAFLFAAAAPNTVGKLWRSDGTEQGTTLVKSIFANDSYSCQPPKPSWPCAPRPTLGYMTVMDGTLFFLAVNAQGEGSELWRSDGTPEGTVAVKDVVPPASGSRVLNLIQAGKTLFFVSEQANQAPRLWRSDGTPDGTWPLDAVSPSRETSSSQHPLAVIGETLFFAADGGSGYELWKSDGTVEGTVLVKDLAPGIASSSPGELTDVNGVLFFVAQSGTLGPELWRSDGTSEGTVLVRGGIPDTNRFLPPVHLTSMGGKLFFSAHEESAGSELWRSNGTPEGTSLLKDIFPGPTGSGPVPAGPLNSGPYNLTASEDRLFFSARDEGSGLELWRSDGTPEGTFRLTDVQPAQRDSFIYQLTLVGQSAFFSAAKPNKSITPWMSDGTPEGTVSYDELTNPSHTGTAGTRFYFAASQEGVGEGLWSIPLCAE